MGLWANGPLGGEYNSECSVVSLPGPLEWGISMPSSRDGGEARWHKANGPLGEMHSLKRSVAFMRRQMMKFLSLGSLAKPVRLRILERYL